MHLCCCLANEMQSVGYSTSFAGIIDPGDAVHPPSYFSCLPPPLLHLLLLFPPSVSSKTAQDTSILVGSQQDRFGPLTCSLSSLLPHLSLSLPVSTSFTRVFTWQRGQWRQQKKEMRDLAMSKDITGTSVRRVWTPLFSFSVLKVHPPYTTAS